LTSNKAYNGPMDTNALSKKKEKKDTNDLLSHFRILEMVHSTH